MSVPAVVVYRLPKLSIVPNAVLVNVQIPPATVSTKELCDPTQTDEGPTMLLGRAFTVTTVVARQPVKRVYTMVTVSAAMPVTVPSGAMVAVAGFTPDQVPPAVVSVSEIVAPMQTGVLPFMAAGKALTVITNDVKHPPGSV